MDSNEIIEDYAQSKHDKVLKQAADLKSKAEVALEMLMESYKSCEEQRAKLSDQSTKIETEMELLKLKQGNADLVEGNTVLMERTLSQMIH